jgi:hypothetical protein
VDPSLADGWPVLILCLLGAVTISLAPTVLACRLESRLVWPYVPAGPTGSAAAAESYALGRGEGRDLPALTDYAARMNEAAEDLGFEPLGTFRDGKGRSYRIRYDFWLSPGGEVLALIGGGTLGPFPVRATWLLTRLADGRCLVTLDNSSGSEPDLAGLTDEAVLGGADFEWLLEHHRGRVDAAPEAPVRYSEEDPLGDHLAFRARRVGRLEELGYVTFLDPEGSAWRYTLKGALAFAVWATGRHLRRLVWPDAWLGPWRR